MTSLRRILFGIAALTLAAIALPAAAQQKIFSVQMSYLGSTTITGPAGTTTALTFRAVYKNETPNGNSTINSIILAAPSGTVITNGQLQGQYVQINTAITGLGGNTISIANMVGIKAGGNTAYIDIQVSTTPPPCTMWSPQAFAGNSFSQPFTLLPQNSTLTVGAGTGCTIDVQMSPSSVNENTNGVAMTATFSNANGGAYSSFTLAAPTTIGLTIPSLPTLTLPGSTTASVAWCGAAGGPICVTNISPAIQPGSQVIVKLTVNIAASCTQSLSGNWSASAFSGATVGSGTIFNTDAASMLATGVNAPVCTIGVSPSPPKNGIAGVALPSITVTVSGGAGSGTAKLQSVSGCTLGAASTTSQALSGGSAVFSNIIISGASTGCSLTFVVDTYSGQAIYGPFQVFANGPLYCQGSGSPSSFQDSSGDASGIRGPSNKDGTACVPVGYNITDTGNSVLLQWDTGSQPGAAFSYCAQWTPRAVSGDPSTWFTNVQVAWYVNGTLTPYANGRSCVGDTRTVAQMPNGPLPVSYGTLGSKVNAGDTSICVVVSAASLPALPFAISVGQAGAEGTERMTVADTTTGGGCGTGGTTWQLQNAALLSHAMTYTDGTTKKVMSNPLPLDSSGNQMQVCIYDDEWTPIPWTGNCTGSPAPGQACVQRTTCALDAGDGGITWP